MTNLEKGLRVAGSDALKIIILIADKLRKPVCSLHGHYYEGYKDIFITENNYA